MKKLIYIFIILGLAVIFNGCENVIEPQNHYVSVYNEESDKYITSVYFRSGEYYDEYWSNNLVSSFIYPYETYDLMFEEGTYDFKVLLEDDYYYYEVDILSVYVYSNVSLDVCLNCYDKKDNAKIIKTPKNKTGK